MSIADDFTALKDRAGRFWSFVEIKSAGDCWPWTRHVPLKGYGRFYISKARTVRAHRAAWMLQNDSLIPDGMIVCHSCDNPKCCNPAHLWIGTDADNNADRAAKGRTVRPPRNEELVRHQRGTGHWASKLTEGQVVAIRSDERPLSQISAAYGISQSTASRIRSGKYYPLLLALKDQPHD